MLPESNARIPLIVKGFGLDKGLMEQLGAIFQNQF
jgi:hypothetical protein